MTAPLVVAIDPGSQHTGIVARQGDQLLGWTVVERGDEDLAAWGQLCSYAAIDLAVETKAYLVLVDVIAIEAYNHPTPQMGSVTLGSVCDTAWLVGYLFADTAALAFRSVLVPPGRHGRAPLGAYPPELVTKNERKPPHRGRDWRLKPAGRHASVSHARSAFDIAEAARQQHNRDQHARRMA